MTSLPFRFWILDFGFRICYLGKQIRLFRVIHYRKHLARKLRSMTRQRIRNPQSEVRNRFVATDYPAIEIQRLISYDRD